MLRGIQDVAPPPVTPPPPEFPSELVSSYLGVSSALLAVSVGIFAFVPLIMQLAVQQSGDPDRARAQNHRAARAFDVMLLSVVGFGVSLCAGLVATYVPWYWIYVVDVAGLGIGVLALLGGTMTLGLTLRAVRKAG